jgi:hypothetical protein
MHEHTRRVETRSRPPAEALPGEECPLPHDPAVSPGVAAAIWRRSGQCCEALGCRRMAEIVAPIGTGPRRSIGARCSRCLEAGR